MIKKATKDDIVSWNSRASEQSYQRLAYFLRFAPSDHVAIQTPEIFSHIQKLFNDFGGWTPEVSKQIGRTPQRRYEWYQ